MTSKYSPTLWWPPKNIHKISIPKNILFSEPPPPPPPQKKKILKNMGWKLLNESAEGRRMTVEIISWSISTKVWDLAGIELPTPGSAVRHASVARHVTEGTIKYLENRLDAINFHFSPIPRKMCIGESTELLHLLLWIFSHPCAFSGRWFVTMVSEM